MQTLGELKKALEENPNNAEAHWRIGCLYGYMGEWLAAFPELEWRLKGHIPSMKMRARYPKPDWNYVIQGKKLLVYQDYGFGDLFQYVRYVEYIPGDVILEVHPYMQRLLQYNFDNHYWRKKYGEEVTVIPQGPLPPYDEVIPLSSLAHWWSEEIPDQIYISPIEQDEFDVPKNAIGIAWAGSAAHKNDSVRSCSPEEFYVLDGKLVSLMMVPSQFRDYSRIIRDWADTAEIISKLECVVTVDTAVAHLAGAMGKKVYLALSYEHDWRWGREKTTPWYPSMKIFRQSETGDWKSVFQQIKKEIDNDRQRDAEYDRGGVDEVEDQEVRRIETSSSCSEPDGNGDSDANGPT